VTHAVARAEVPLRVVRQRLERVVADADFPEGARGQSAGFLVCAGAEELLVSEDLQGQGLCSRRCQDAQRVEE
jgi:hypothetical protein